eukprot:CAMPEP_0185574634 /NCGR_PEP_ID=MMETSP0434-20130131/6053_1 /TAXON_ID=626734 ORGANISM="Favella taraikaensis, Strain Fe Narragansett Bay" /NCGR_SAMPLE_ID=MMETSP0434 /ASSEMBLY_ACC=CAM_ASM_000379 /LENGTH=65 /DNA_ID=CAMNT_0028191273 /DNA_START=411 /DNA_END=608 /DNA_ORIENTATION=+
MDLLGAIEDRPRKKLHMRQMVQERPSPAVNAIEALKKLNEGATEGHPSPKNETMQSTDAPESELV